MILTDVRDPDIDAHPGDADNEPEHRGAYPPGRAADITYISPLADAAAALVTVSASSRSPYSKRKGM